MEDLRIKLAALWLFNAVNLLSFSLIWTWEPGVIDQFRAGVIEGMEVGPAFLMTFAIVFLVPPAMAFLSLTLSRSVIRWPNIIVPIVFIVLGIITGHPSAHAILITIIDILVLALIAWYSWKWPTE